MREYGYALAVVGTVLVSAVAVGLTTWVAATLRRSHLQAAQLDKLLGKLSDIRDGNLPHEAMQAKDRPPDQLRIIRDQFESSVVAGLIAIRLIAQRSNLSKNGPSSLIHRGPSGQPTSNRSEAQNEDAYRAIRKAHEAFRDIIDPLDAAKAVGWLDAFASLPAQLVTQRLDRAEPRERTQLLVALAMTQHDAAAAQAVADMLAV